MESTHLAKAPQRKSLTRGQRLWTVRVIIGLVFIGLQSALVWKAIQPKTIEDEFGSLIDDNMVVLAQIFLWSELVTVVIMAAIVGAMIGSHLITRWINKGQ